ncbi:unnamed protein product [Ambrosiozyma monospora]|uniref:Unnamed protein product n=1 Tax=Ambrosiozyma monospora TaxID=43982 RepID=A0A9W7DF67_AMBMO|nr:unnamed protein product [Ambrosiozyma monospora]
MRSPTTESIGSNNVTLGATSDKFNLRSPITPTAAPLSPKKADSEGTSRTPSLRLLAGLTSPTAASTHFSDADVSSTQELTSRSVRSFHGKRKVVLSRKVLLDLDHSGSFDTPELVNVHYDIVHNPEHCFHIRLEWLNTTSKLVEDAVGSWAKHCLHYGLTMVEIPWDELCNLPERNPLHSSIDISLALDPWTDPEFCTNAKLEHDKYFYHTHLLNKSGFLLDNRTAKHFNDDSFDVSYSWGKPTFKYAQFIHVTGAYIAELRGNGEFFLAPNNAHIARVNLQIGQTQQRGKRSVYLDSQSVMLDFRETCEDKAKLRELFRAAK